MYIKIPKIFELQKNLSNYDSHINYIFNNCVYDICFTNNNSIKCIGNSFLVHTKGKYNNYAIFPSSSEYYFLRNQLVTKLKQIINIKETFRHINCFIFFVIPFKESKYLSINTDEKQKEITNLLKKAILLKIEIVIFSSYYDKDTHEIYFDNFVELELK